MTPTPEQLAIIDAARSSGDSLIINAMAGCAKTSTLVMIAHALPMKPSLALAFNKKIQKELEKKLPKHFEVLTLNGLGHRAWSRAIGRRCIVNTSKLFETLRETFNDLKVPSSNGVWSTTQTLIKAARHAGLVPEPLSQQFRGLIPDDWPSWEALADSHYLDISDDIVWMARRTLAALVRKGFNGEMDYDDQIYLSSLFGGAFPRFPLVMVDESQDLSLLNHTQIRRVASDRIIAVGDERQAIYAFRGADAASMGTLRGLRERWLDLPLSTTFRCPRSIVARQQLHAPGFTAAHELEGEVYDWTSRASWSIGDLGLLSKGAPIAILCRNNAPIISAALRIIRSGQGCTVLGSEIGKSLITLSRKILQTDDLSTEECIRLIEAWKAKEIQLAEVNKKPEKSEQITDRAECLLAVITSQPDLTSGDLRRILGTMFSKENLRITLATGHKAKGLEWHTVVHLDPFRIPSKYVLRAAQNGNGVPLEQDRNLNYVIETRAQHTLVLANLEGMR